MCFTVNVNIIKEELEKRFNTSFIDHENFRPSYYYHANSLPELPVAGHFDRVFNIRLLKWGLIPGWTEGEEEAQKIRFMTFNARAETLATKSSYKYSLRSRRCLIPVRGFFEWQHKGGTKIPWYIYPVHSDIMLLAGLYDTWKNPGGNESINTFTIVTTQSNNLLSEIHNTKKRMPLILEEEKAEKWLDINTGDVDIEEILKPYPDELLKAHTISPLINSKRINRNTPELIEAYSYPDQTALF